MTLHFLRLTQKELAESSDLTASISDEYRKLLDYRCIFLDRCVKDFELDATHSRFLRLQSVLKKRCSLAELAFEIKVMLQTLEDEVRHEEVAYIPAKKAELDFKAMFSRDLLKKFPSIKYDAEAACRSYMLDLNTACVYHAVGVAQRGLYALARELKVPFSQSLELENWKNIIDQIEKKIRELEKLPKTPEKDKTVKFYSEAAIQFRYFKDAWRNHVNHNRERYDPHQAHSILVHVRDFIAQLAEHGLKDPA